MHMREIRYLYIAVRATRMHALASTPVDFLRTGGMFFAFFRLGNRGLWRLRRGIEYREIKRWK